MVVLYIQFVVGVQFLVCFGQFLCIVQVFQCVLGYCDVFLCIVQFEVVVCYFGGDQDLCIGQVGLFGIQVCVCGFGGMVFVVEQIQFLVGVEVELVVFIEYLLFIQLWIGLFVVVVVVVSGDVWSLVEVVFYEYCVGLVDVGYGYVKVQVV